MKKLHKRRLELRRVTIAILTGPALERVIGGVGGPTWDAGVDSVMNGDKLEPCQPPSADPGQLPPPPPRTTVDHI